jgi:transglutaminase-like putative cysteine protease
MRLKVRHVTVYEYEPPASKVGLRLRLFPADFDGQSVDRWLVTVNGDRVEKLLTDGFANRLGLWLQHSACERAEIIAEGVVNTEDKAGVVRGLKRRPPPAIFLHETAKTRPNAAIRDLARGVAGETPLATMHALSAAVGEAVAYRPGQTTEDTTAAEALKLGAGVCQDHAHVFIAGARSLGVPARYVTGYLLAGDDTNEDFATHAWAEAYVGEIGWIGFDPSNGMSPTDRYIRLAVGMDAHAAAPIRGTVTGETTETLTAHVEITSDTGGTAQSQSQSQSTSATASGSVGSSQRQQQ